MLHGVYSYSYISTTLLQIVVYNLCTYQLLSVVPLSISVAPVPFYSTPATPTCTFEVFQISLLGLHQCRVQMIQIVLLSTLHKWDTKLHLWLHPLRLPTLSHFCLEATFFFDMSFILLVNSCFLCNNLVFALIKSFCLTILS